MLSSKNSECVCIIQTPFFLLLSPCIIQTPLLLLSSLLTLPIHNRHKDRDVTFRGFTTTISASQRTLYNENSDPSFLDRESKSLVHIHFLLSLRTHKKHVQRSSPHKISTKHGEKREIRRQNVERIRLHVDRSRKE